MRNERIALVTGANKGIGLEIARQLATKGHRVFVGARNRDAGAKAVAALQKGGGNATLLELDVADPASIRRAAKELAAQVDQLDVLVNNAGIMEDKRSIFELEDETLLRTLTTNTFGPLRVTK